MSRHEPTIVEVHGQQAPRRWLHCSDDTVTHSLNGLPAMRGNGTYRAVRDRVAMTMSSWEDELRSLRASLGPTISMRLRWRSKMSHRSNVSGWEALFGDEVDTT